MDARATTTRPTVEPGISVRFRSIRLRAFVFALAAILLGGGLVSSASQSYAEPAGANSMAEASAPACDPDWQIVPVSTNSDVLGELHSVAVVSPVDVWAVGTSIGRWDGTQWSIVPSPNPGSDSFLRSVAVVSPTDVWAVGTYYYGSSQTLIERWDGTQWSIVPSPNPGSDSFLRSVAVVSPTDVWAVGTYYYGSYGSSQTLIERWDGYEWNIVPGVDPSTTYSALYSVAAVSSKDVWAVGIDGGSLIEHWDGTQWSRVDSPNRGTYSALYSIAAVSPKDVWAVGQYAEGSVRGTVTEHWDGTQWSIVDSPSPDPHENELYSVAVVSSTDVWAVGAYGPFTGWWSTTTLIEHWNGTQWEVVPSPNQGNDGNELHSVAVARSTDVTDMWAVGSYLPQEWQGWHGLVERYNPCPPAATPTATVTRTPPTYTPTRTSTPPR